jgi:hypothetical protein
MISHLGIMFTAGLGRWLSRSDLVPWRECEVPMRTANFG